MQNPHPPPPDERKWTILGLLKWATAYFGERHIDSPRATAEILAAHALGLRRIDLYLRYDQPLTASELTRIKPLIRRRVAREPVAYITGEKEFWSLSLAVGPAVLIPRPETEVLVETVLNRMAKLHGSGGALVLELGTGSGAISLALASEAPGHRYIATDISPAALAVAAANAQRLGMRDRIAFVAADWFTTLGGQPGFDLIVSNPPYIRQADMDGLQAEVRCFEPVTALNGGESGLAAIGHLIDTAPHFLSRGGALAMEIGHDQKNAVQRQLLDAGTYENISFARDLAGIERVAVAERQ